MGSWRSPLLFRWLPQTRFQSRNLLMTFRPLFTLDLLNTPVEHTHGVSAGWVLPVLSHPAFCSAGKLSSRVVPSGGRVRLQRDHVEMLLIFQSAIISEVAASLASLQLTSRSVLGLSPPGVLCDDLDTDEQAAGKTECPDDARILEASYDEHDLRNRTWNRLLAANFPYGQNDCRFHGCKVKVSILLTP